VAKHHQPTSAVAEKQPQPVVAEADAAAYIGYSPAALKAWRMRRTGPPYIRTNRSIRYRISDLDAWLSRHRVEPERAAKRAADAAPASA
jgi:hypothetical protein